MFDTNVMPRKKKTDPAEKAGSEVYRKPAKAVRIRQSLVDAGEAEAAKLAQDFTQFVNDSVRLRLEGLGAWPPKPRPKP